MPFKKAHECEIHAYLQRSHQMNDDRSSFQAFLSYRIGIYQSYLVAHVALGAGIGGIFGWSCSFLSIYGFHWCRFFQYRISSCMSI